MQYIFLRLSPNPNEKKKTKAQKNTGTTEICNVKRGFSFSFIHKKKRKDVGRNLFWEGTKGGVWC